MTTITAERQLTPMESFQEKLKSKLRDDIASLLPDEAVAEMVQKVIKEEFFQKRQVPKPGRSHYSGDTVEAPSPFQEAVIAASKPIIDKYVAQAFKDNEAVIREQITESLKEGLVKMTIATIDARIQAALAEQGYSLQNAIAKSLTL